MADTPRVTVPVEQTEAMRLVPDRVLTETLYWMARAYERVHSMPRVSDTDLANKIEAAKADLGRARDASPVLPNSAAPAPEGGAVMKAEDAPVWADGIVTDGERVSMAQKAEADHGGTYWAVDGGDGGLDWEPTHFVSLTALATRELLSDPQQLEAPAEAAPCPFCGCRMRVSYDSEREMYGPDGDHLPGCIIGNWDLHEYAFRPDALAAWNSRSVRAQPPAREVPAVNIKCETDVGTAVGSTRLNVIRVEREDDGSFTAVTDHWPPAREEAPAPEGGAVETAVKIATDLHHAYEQLIYGLPKYLEAENLTDEENMIREAWITLDVTAHRLAALATREEAPAEAGEDAEAIVRRWANWIIDESSDMDHDDHDAGKRKIRAERDFILSALRAQPPARSGEGQ